MFEDGSFIVCFNLLLLVSINSFLVLKLSCLIGISCGVFGGSVLCSVV